MDTQQTDWFDFAPDDPSLPAQLLDRIAGKTAETWVSLEAGEYGATITPYTDDEAPHVLLYLTFPKGRRFSERVAPLPAPAELDDETRDDALVRVPLQTSSRRVVAIAIDLLRRCGADAPTWRCCIGDTYVSRFGY